MVKKNEKKQKKEKKRFMSEVVHCDTYVPAIKPQSRRISVQEGLSAFGITHMSSKSLRGFRLSNVVFETGPSFDGLIDIGPVLSDFLTWDLFRFVCCFVWYSP